MISYDCQSCPICQYIVEENCICSCLPSSLYDTETRIVIIQDSAELNPSKRKLSSIPILQHVLKNVETHVVNAGKSFDIGIDFSDSSCAILYPSESSTPLAECDQELTEPIVSCSNRIRTLVVIDGSWVTVQHIMAKHSCLQPHRSRHVRLNSETTSASAYESYGLRKEPSRNFLSTAEAVAWALLCLEGSQHEAPLEILRLFTEFARLSALSRRVSPSDGTPVIPEQRVAAADYSVEYVYDCTSNSSRNSCGDSKESPGDPDTLLPSKGVREKVVLTKSQRRQRHRLSEARRRRRK